MSGARQDMWGAREALALDRALVLGAQALQLLGIERHAEGEPHLSQDGLDLVQRLLAEVLGLEQLRLGLLHEVGDGADVGVALGSCASRLGPRSKCSCRSFPEGVRVQYKQEPTRSIPKIVSSFANTVGGI